MRKYLFYSGTLTLLVTLFNFQPLFAQNTSPYWSLAGNSNASSTTSKLGTTNAINLRLFANNVERIHINYSNGYVGIGTTAPTYKLHVANNANAIYGYTTGTTSVGVWGSSPYRGVYGNGATGVYGNASITTGYGVYGHGGAYGVYGISVSGYGIYGSSTNSYGGYITSSNSDALDAYTSNGYFGVYAISGNSAGYGAYGNGGSYGVYGYSTSGQGIHGDSYDGLGGIFHSTNDWGIQASTDNGYYAGAFFGNVWTSGMYATSDGRLKKNIEDVGDALSIINKLQPKHYEFKTDEPYKALHLPTGMHYGLLAQDLELVLPNLVHEEKFTLPVKTEPVIPKKTPDGKDENNYRQAAVPAKTESVNVKAVNYTELIPIMVKAMQEQQQQIGQLKDENSNLRKDVSDLKNEMLQLKALITKNNLTGNSYDLNVASMEQNAPNPFNSATIIRYHLPESASSAQVIITDASGRIMKTISLKSRGSGELTLNSGALAAGSYNYTLWIDEKQVVDSKKMVITK